MVDAELIIEITLGLVAFVFSATCHEAAHAWAALRGGDETAYVGGQVSLDPLPHIRRSPFGMILAPILCTLLMGYPMGWASAPYDPYWASRHPHRYGLMSLAGPMANLLIAIVALILLKIGLSNGLFLDALNSENLTGKNSPWMAVFTLLLTLYNLNVILFLFNLIPLPPLDGTGVLLLFYPEEKAGRVTAAINGIGVFGLPLAWILFSGLLNKTPLMAFVHGLLY